jgi:hypothetical protein
MFREVCELNRDHPMNSNILLCIPLPRDHPLKHIQEDVAANRWMCIAIVR